ncbi:46061_t:CDS:2 [Gigaspora margarita]|uniref:46061_t:CDS:1 n=1 Tax=Gigaspora margarita TaxID=4874 RepID=A0ABM8VWW2_GIGMA|nr:46061_t:CDS:2 [Gigaspora margarita]
MTSRFGYSKFADQFTLKKAAVQNNLQLVNKANQIISSYQQKIKNKEWKESKEKELGKFPTGKKIKVDGKDEEEKVYSFTSADQIRAYDFGDAFNTREAIWGIYDQIGQEVTVINATKNVNAEIAQDIRGIKNLMLEVNDVQNQFREVQNKVNEINNAMDTMREGFNNNLRILQSNIERIGAQGVSSGEIAVIKSRLATLESKISSGNFGSGSSSSGSGGSGAEEIRKRLDTLLEELRSNLSSLSSTDVFNRFIKFYNTGEALELLSNLENNNVDLVFLDPQYEKVANVLKLDYPLYPQRTWLRSNAEFCFLLQKYPTTEEASASEAEGVNKVLVEHLLSARMGRSLTAITNESDLVVDPCAGSFIVLEVCRELKRDYLGCDLTFKEMSKFQKENKTIHRDKQLSHQ